MYRIQELAKMAGVSIRTLHYYDQINLLNPSTTLENGYRAYGQKELIKLQQILFFKELEFSLEQIINIVNSPKFEINKALDDQKKLLKIKRERIGELIKTIEQTKLELKGGKDMKNLYQGFSKDTLEKYKEEARERWGETEAYKQSAQRTRNWTKKDYANAAEETKQVSENLAKVMDLPVDSKEVQEAIDAHYKSIAKFYDLSAEMYLNLGKMYVEDPRFTAHYEQYREGLAVFVYEAIKVYAKNKKS